MTRHIVAALLLSVTPAFANGPYEPPPNPGYVVNNTNQNANWNQNANTNTNTNQQDQKQHQGQVQAQRQGQGQSQSANNNNNVNVNNSTRAAASSAIAGNVAGCQEGASASIQVLDWGVGVAKCRGDYYPQVVDAEERAKRGDRAGAIYLSHRDEGARVAFQQMGVVETSQMRRERKGAPSTTGPATAPDALWSVCEWRNGAPYVRVKAGRNVNAAVAQCMSYFRGAR